MLYNKPFCLLATTLISFLMAGCGASTRQKMELFEQAKAVEWQKCAQAVTAAPCEKFMSYYGGHPQAYKKIQTLKAMETRESETETQEKLEAIFQRDSQLPIEMRRDKYMVALSAHLKNERYQESMHYFKWLQRLNTKLSPSFNYFYGEALLKTGNPDEAISKLYAYITEVGTNGKFYKKALELVNEAESGAFDVVNKPSSDQQDATLNMSVRERAIFKRQQGQQEQGLFETVNPMIIKR